MVAVPDPPKYVSWGKQLTGRMEARLVFGRQDLVHLRHPTVAGYAIAIPRNRGIAIGRVVGDLRVEMRDLRIELPGHFKSPVVSA
jgi:hypothetical protein